MRSFAGDPAWQLLPTSRHLQRQDVKISPVPFTSHSWHSKLIIGSMLIMHHWNTPSGIEWLAKHWGTGHHLSTSFTSRGRASGWSWAPTSSARSSMASSANWSCVPVKVANIFANKTATQFTILCQFPKSFHFGMISFLANWLIWPADPVDNILLTRNMMAPL